MEHDPEEIWRTTIKTLKDVIAKAKKLRGKILSIGITIKEKQQFYGTTELENRFIKQLFGKTEDKRIFVEIKEAK